jgi:tRNA nucleotidyltransferase (CCA-adding enzyme)
LRYGNDFVKRCVHLVTHHMYYYQPEWTRSTVRRFIRRIGEENLEHLFELRRADLMSRDLPERAREVEALRRRVLDELDTQHALKIEDMAIDGNDVMHVVGITAGEAVGEILQAVFDRVIEEPSLNERERLLEILKGFRKG